jgi:hypothetical protein
MIIIIIMIIQIINIPMMLLMMMRSRARSRGQAWCAMCTGARRWPGLKSLRMLQRITEIVSSSLLYVWVMMLRQIIPLVLYYVHWCALEPAGGHS